MAPINTTISSSKLGNNNELGGSATGAGIRTGAGLGVVLTVGCSFLGSILGAAFGAVLE